MSVSRERAFEITTSTTDGEKVYVGMGDAGIRQGDKIVACGFNAVLVHSGEKCTTFKGDYRGGLTITGNALFSGQMAGNVAEKMASYDEAKAKLKK